MKMERDALAQALEVFADVQPSDAEVGNLLTQVDDSKDLLCHILLNTDFLIRYPDVAAILRGLSGPVSRSLLASPDVAPLRERMKRSLLQEMYEKQKSWASKAEELKRLEVDLIAIRKKIENLGGL